MFTMFGIHTCYYISRGSKCEQVLSAFLFNLTLNYMYSLLSLKSHYRSTIFSFILQTHLSATAFPEYIALHWLNSYTGNSHKSRLQKCFFTCLIIQQWSELSSRDISRNKIGKATFNGDNVITVWTSTRIVYLILNGLSKYEAWFVRE